MKLINILALMPSFLFTCFVNHQGGKRALQARQRKIEEKSAKSRATDWTGYGDPQVSQGFILLFFVKVKLNTKHVDFLATFLCELRREILLIGLDFRTVIRLAAEVMIF